MDSFIDKLHDKGYFNISKLEDDRYIAMKNEIEVLIKIIDSDSKEAEALIELNDINHISRLIETLKFDKQQIIVIEFIKSVELDKYLENNQTRSLQDNLHITNSLIKIIKDIHNHGWIHGDIHTNNIIIDDDLNISIIDFGTALKTTKKHSIFVPLYLPPESLLLENDMYVINSNYVMDYKCDYWALGLVLHRIFIAGFIPSASNFMLEQFNHAEIDKIYQSYSCKLELPIEINNLIFNLLKFDPDQRVISNEKL